MKKLFLFLLVVFLFSDFGFAYDAEAINQVFYIRPGNIEELFDENGNPGENLTEFIGAMNERIDYLASEGEEDAIPAAALDLTKNIKANVTLSFHAHEDVTIGLVTENNRITTIQKDGVDGAEFNVRLNEDTLNDLSNSDNPGDFIISSMANQEIQVEGLTLESQITVAYLNFITNPLTFIFIVAILIALALAAIKFREHLQ
ncbi:MAG: hypothetical protein ABIH20_02640 [Candidatus Diapherotrites archaeon]